MINKDKLVSDYAKENPNAVDVFIKNDIDFCCGGGLSLSVACKEKGLDYDHILMELNKPTQEESKIDANSLSVVDLIDHIISTHHNFLYKKLKSMAVKARKIAISHKNHTHLGPISRILNTFYLLSEELLMHMEKEEKILFPHIKCLYSVNCCTQNEMCNFNIKKAIFIMEIEHDTVGSLLKELRKMTNDYQAPDKGCIKITSFYNDLEIIEADIFHHIHKENNILHPKAIQKEKECLQKNKKSSENSNNLSDNDNHNLPTN